MPAFPGKFQYTDPRGGKQTGGCRLSFEGPNLTVAPERGTPWVFDLGDVDVFAPGDYDLALTLYTGARFDLSQFGKAFQDLIRDLLEAYRRRLLQILLLEDLEEVARFEGSARLESPRRAFSSPAEFRLYKSNIAVLPSQATGLQYRYADLEGVTLDQSAYTVTLECGDERLVAGKLAKRTGEFAACLEDAAARLRERAAAAVHDLFPFLDPAQFQEAARLMAEGRAAPIDKLRAISPRIEQALAANAVDQSLKPYFDFLASHTPAGWLYAGFKLLRPDEAQDGSSGPGDNAGPDSDAAPANAAGDGEDGAAAAGGEAPILYWFFYPLHRDSGASSPQNLVAWEASSASGRATYFFRLVDPAEAGSLAGPDRARPAVEAAIRDLNRAIGLLNFRRAPIYLSDDALALDPRYRRYAIACRKLPELRRLRASFLGRAIHTTPEAWQKQVEAFLAQA